MSEGGESNHDEARDLFLAPKPKVKREGWVAVGDRFGSAMDMRACSSAYPSKDSCERVFPGRAIVHIEWEEESE